MSHIIQGRLEISVVYENESATASGFGGSRSSGWNWDPEEIRYLLGQHLPTAP